MSERRDTHMASTAMADGDGGDADDVAEEDHNGGGQPDGQDDNDADSDLLREEEDGEMAEEEGEGLQAAADSESESDDSDDDGGPLGDGLDDDDYDDDGYEEDGHPILAATTVEVPDGCWRPDDIEVRFPHGTNEATKQLALDVIGRTVTSPQQVARLMQQNADPDVIPWLRRKGHGCSGLGYSLVHLAIDNKSGYTVENIQAEDDDAFRLVALPHWSSDELQSAVLTALLDGGADPNAAADGTGEQTLLRVAIASGNQTALDLLMAQQGIDLRVPHPYAPMVMELPRSPLRPPPTEYLQLLMPMFRQLITRDPTLAAQRDAFNENLVHRAAAQTQVHYPQSFIDSYLDLITANGADIMAVDGTGYTPLHEAALWGSPHVTDYLCRKLPAAQIDRRTNDGQTPLALAANRLDHYTQELQDPDTPDADKERYRAKIPNYEQITHSLLRAGADISTIPTATEENRRGRQLVLTEYATVLNQLPTAVMAAVNAAFAPHRSLAALLTPRLAVGPQEAPIFGWRIASYIFDMAAAQEATTDEAVGVRHSDMARRVCAAAEHFVKSAEYQASSNREVVGGTANVGGQVVRVPQLQCFVVGGVGGRKMELREVVHWAILDEAAKWELVGEIDNGFSKDVAVVEWEAVGWVERGRDGRETFTSLGMT
ncbi:unnamed protein product [Vitrella brassicaformis CCMP3155]|uniref:Uncharacterized protein n=1 Tax=Vitrella brassicaformis (strain CCMP3155) TaxID=1169540 RepID=A0A0G4GLY0_VITBC|nr:unnamed protein product [Vitrella brassicaformis CCMP3155]|eukprot:CEM31121.1 unnamed protein product [Vitrella brassicaformis CCMP3155]